MNKILACAVLLSALALPLSAQITVFNTIFPGGSQAIWWNGEPMVLMFAPAGYLQWTFLNPSTTQHELGLSLAAIAALDSRPCASGDVYYLYSDDQTGFQDLAWFSMSTRYVQRTPSPGLLSNPMYPSRYLAHPVMGQRTDWWGDYRHSGFVRPNCTNPAFPEWVVAIFKVHVLR